MSIKEQILNGNYNNSNIREQILNGTYKGTIVETNNSSNHLKAETSEELLKKWNEEFKKSEKEKGLLYNAFLGENIFAKNKHQENSETYQKYLEALEQENKIENDNISDIIEKSIVNPETIPKTALTTTNYIGQGILKGAEGLADAFVDVGTSNINPYYWFNQEELQEHNAIAKEIIETDATNELITKLSGDEKFNQNVLDKSSLVKSTNIGGQVAQGIGQMLPAIALGNPIAATGTIGVSSYGSGVEEAYNDGATTTQARLYGLGNMATEMATEWLTGGVPGVKSKLFSGLDNIVAKGLGKETLEEVSQSLTKELLQAGYKMVGEGTEEALTEILKPLLKNTIYTDGEKINWEEVINSFIVGGITGGVLEAPANISNVKYAYKNTVNNARNLVQNNSNNVLAPLVVNNTNTGIKNSLNIDTNNAYRYEVSDNQKINAFNESIKNSGLINSETTKSFADICTKVIQDRDVNILVDSTLENNVNGLYDANTNTIKINPNSERAAEFILTHELTHSIATDEMIRLANDYASKNLDFKTSVESLLNQYNKTEIDEEVLADISGQLFGNQEFINNLSMQEPSLFKKIYNKIIEWANKLTGNTHEALFIRDLKNKWETAYRNQGNRSGSEIKYSTIGLKGAKNLASNSDSRYYKNLLNNQKNAVEIFNNSNENLENTNIKSKQETGWFQTKYGDWSTLISDKNSKLLQKLEPNKTYKLGNILEHDLLYKAYPELQKLRIKTADIDSTGGYATFSLLPANTATDEIYIRNSDLNKKDFRKTLLHEINHYIEHKEKYDKRSRGADSKTIGMENYRNNLGEIISNETKMNADLTQEQLDAIILPEQAKEKPQYKNIREKLLESNRNDLLKNGDGKNALQNLGLPIQNKIQNNKVVNKKNNKSSRIINDIEELDNSSFSFKQKQLDIILENNPAEDDFHTWIRTIDDVKTFDETLQDNDWADYVEEGFNPDYTGNMVKEALETGKITVYSSYPIEQGIFVSPSRMEAESYSGDGKIYSKEVNIDDIAWIDPTQGQYAKVDSEVNYSQNNNSWKEHLEENYKSTGTKTYFKDMMPYAITEPSNESIKNIQSMETSSENKTESNQSQKNAKLLDKRPLAAKPTIKDGYHTFIREMVDKGETINRLAKKSGNSELYAKYDHMGTSEAEGHYAIAIAQTDNSGNKIGKSVVEIWKPVEDAGLVEEFSNYLLHKHNIARWEQGKPVFGESITSNMSRKFVEESEKAYPQFKEWSNDINIYNKNQMQNMVDAGLTSKESQEYLNNTYNSYIRIYREINGTSPITQFRNNLKVNTPIKKAKGGNQNILPLKDSMAQQTIEIKKAIRRNEFGLELLNVLDNGENTEYDGKQQVVKNDDGTYSFTVFKDGTPIKMEIDEGIYEALKPSEIKNPKILAPIRGLSRIQRSLLTDKNPLFIATNFLKDLGDAPFNSKYGSKFAKNYVVAAKEMMNNSDLWNKYKALGGEQNTYFDYEKGVKIPSNSKISKFVRKIQNINQVVEQLPRFTEFISTLEAGGTEAQAMYNAAEITTNFKRGGDIAKAMNRNGANFLNASIQGFDKQIRNFTGQKGAKGYINLLAKATILGVLPSVLNHLLLDDDEDYQELPDYIKDTYYLFKVGDNEFVRIPKGRVMSTFGMTARRSLEYADGEKDAFDGLLNQVTNQVAPNNPLEDNVFAPFLAIKNNRSWNGSEIVPQRLQNELPENQYDEKTDVISKFIGKTFRVSPKKVNYLLDQYTGGIGDVLLPVLSPDANQNPISAKFTANSVINNKYVSDFYDTKDKLTKQSNSLNASDEDKLKTKYFNSINYEMNELYKEKREIQNSNLTNNEKYKRILEIQDKINNIAQFALEDYNDFYINDGYAYVGDKEFYKNSENEWEKIKEKDLEYIKELNLTEEEKNEYYKTKIAISSIRSDNSKTSQQKHLDIAKKVLDSNMSEKTIAKLYSKYYSDEDTLNNILKAEIPIKEFIKFNSQEFTSDYKNGKAITDSRKHKIFNYIDSLNLNVAQKAFLMKMEYSSFNQYDNAVYQYINSLNLNKFEKTLLAKQIGFGGNDKYLIEYISKLDISKNEKEDMLKKAGFRIIDEKIYS